MFFFQLSVHLVKNGNHVPSNVKTCVKGTQHEQECVVGTTPVSLHVCTPPRSRSVDLESY